MRFSFAPLLLVGVIAGCGAERGRGTPSSDDRRTGQSDTTGPSLQIQPSSQSAPDGIAIRLVPADERGSRAVFEVDGLSDANLAELAKLGPNGWAAVFSVHVIPATRTNEQDLPAVMGSHRIADRRLQFEPAFPLEPGVRYRARFELKPPQSGSTAADLASTTPLAAADFTLSKPTVEPTTRVSHVFPSANLLPENQLKFYLHFSAPMSRGEAYTRVHLFDSSGEEIEAPFLELDEELWDPQGKRFTLFLDPGRIKRGLKPREEAGPVFQEGRSYVLVIDREWLDATGSRLLEGFRKEFRAGPPDDEQPDPNTWQVQSPSASSLEPLAIHFPEPLDHAMLQRVIVVHDAAERPIRGHVEVQEQETCWSFIPDRPWLAGDYTIEVQTDLEDLAGNSISRVFDVDLLEPISRSMKAERWSLPFRVE